MTQDEMRYDLTKHLAGIMTQELFCQSIESCQEYVARELLNTIPMTSTRMADNIVKRLGDMGSGNV